MKTIDDDPSDSEGISRRLASVGPWTVFVFHAAIALEVIIMITPFTAYFYSVYAPALGFLEAHRATAWLTAFFLPHISYSPSFIVSTLTVLGPVLIGLGLVAFLVCAFQVYSAKLLRRGVVSGGLYRMVRHPQYLSLAVAGGEHESHHGGGDNGGIAAAVRHLFDMYTLKPLRQLRAGARSPNQRVIFTMAETSSGDPTTAERALAVDVLRIPLFFTDLEADRPVMTMDTPPRHSWGTIPVPAF
jgi:hypothetical protein